MGRLSALLVLLLFQCAISAVNSQRFHFSFNSRSGFSSHSNSRGHGTRAAASTRLYDVIGVKPDATEKEIRSAYRRKSVTLHPDKGGSEEEFKELTSAYGVLNDAEKRRIYDATGDENPGESRGSASPRNQGGFDHFFSQQQQRRPRMPAVNFGTESIEVDDFNIQHQFLRLMNDQNVRREKYDRPHQAMPLVLFVYSSRWPDAERFVKETWRPLCSFLLSSDLAFCAHTDSETSWLANRLGVRSIPSIVVRSAGHSWSSPFSLGKQDLLEVLQTIRPFLPFDFGEDVAFNQVLDAPVRNLRDWEGFRSRCEPGKIVIAAVLGKGNADSRTRRLFFGGVLNAALAVRHSACVIGVVPESVAEKAALLSAGLEPDSWRAFSGMFQEGGMHKSRAQAFPQEIGSFYTSSYKFSRQYRYGRAPRLTWHSFTDLCSGSCFVALLRNSSVDVSHIYYVLREVDATKGRAGKPNAQFRLPIVIANKESSAAFVHALGMGDNADIAVAWLSSKASRYASISNPTLDSLRDFGERVTLGRLKLHKVDIKHGVANNLRALFPRPPEPSLVSNPLMFIQLSVARIIAVGSRLVAVGRLIIAEGVLPLIFMLLGAVALCSRGRRNNNLGSDTAR